jgi:hypothetical protein
MVILYPQLSLLPSAVRVDRASASGQGAPMRELGVDRAGLINYRTSYNTSLCN